MSLRNLFFFPAKIAPPRLDEASQAGRVLGGSARERRANAHLPGFGFVKPEGFPAPIRIQAGPHLRRSALGHGYNRPDLPGDPAQAARLVLTGVRVLWEDDDEWTAGMEDELEALFRATLFSGTAPQGAKPLELDHSIQAEVTLGIGRPTS